MRVKSFKDLPEGYKKVDALDLKEDKRLLILVNVLSILLILPFIPLYIVFNYKISNTQIYVSVLFIFIGYIIIIIIHELIHGIFFKLGTKEKIKYRFHGVYASASVDHIYFKKNHYLVVSLAPVVILTIVLSILAYIFCEDYFLHFYILIAIQFGSAAGDFYVVYRLLKHDKNTLIRDYGVGMEFYHD
ncbi:MAG: DUF3267 domain-containing protein [Bacilli bacterium]|nr:DUF3267 domain-containing protein [Bacilli bacterium]